MRITLVQSPCWGIKCPPYGLAVLSTYLRSKGHQVYIKDLNIEFYYERSKEYADAWNPENHSFWVNPVLVSNFIFSYEEALEEKVNDILNTGAEIIGFSIHFSSEHLAKEIAKRIKKKDEKRIIVFGGPQASRVNSGFKLLELSYVDFVVQGEGEITLEELVGKLGLSRQIDFCAGTILKKDGKIIDCGDRPLIPDLDSLPFTDFSDLDFTRYTEPSVLPMFMSRGCPNKCIFCNEKPYWRSFRHRSAENIFVEIKERFRKSMHIEHIDFHDSLVNGNVRELEKLCDLIKSSGMKFRWSGQAAITKEMTYHLLLKMRLAGCVCLNYGLETGSPGLMQRIGKLLAKDADLDKIVRDTHNVGIEGIYNFMFGFPGETEEEFQETLDFLSRNKNYIDVVNPSPGFCAFDKGSYGYDHPDEFDIIVGITGSLWESKDGVNNYAARIEKFERFLEETRKLGIKSFYPYDRVINRDTILGYYYFMKKEWNRAILYLNEAVKQQPSNESNWAYLAKSLAFLGEKERAGRGFDEIIKIRLAKNDLPGAKEIAAEAQGMGLIVSSYPA
ncbi:MAG: radical SAM protein [Candidatus Omnitrophica bacterium]|nr:radical SAM protein [Candidatus Omnitrophota bacterium]